MPAPKATVQFGAIVVATGFAATFAGGWLGDALLRRTRQGYLWLSGAGALLAAPLASASSPIRAPRSTCPAVAPAELFLFASTGPINSTIVNVVRPGQRATAVALSTATIHLLGDVPFPPLIGDPSSLE